MENNLNYPIRYGILEIKEKRGLVTRGGKLEDDIETVAYIVEKCYVISRLTRYFPDGNEIDDYQIVFPYKNLDYLGLVRRDPEFSKNGECINSDMLTQVFSTFEEAKTVANYKNKSLSDIGTLHKYLEVEETIKELTSDMENSRGR